MAHLNIEAEIKKKLSGKLKNKIFEIKIKKIKK